MRPSTGRHEAQAALVDADEGHVERRQLAGDAQHGAVAAHHDRAVGLLADALRAHGRDSRHVQVRRGIRFKYHVVAALLQEAQHVAHGLLDAGRVGAHHQGDRVVDDGFCRHGELFGSGERQAKGTAKNGSPCHCSAATQGTARATHHCPCIARTPNQLYVYPV
jgi:hypothetical protein